MAVLQPERCSSPGHTVQGVVSQEWEAWVRQFCSLNAVAPQAAPFRVWCPRSEQEPCIAVLQPERCSSPGHTVQGVVFQKREAWVRQPYSLNAVAPQATPFRVRCPKNEKRGYGSPTA
jgi:hypothetical protein